MNLWKSFSALPEKTEREKQFLGTVKVPSDELLIFFAESNRRAVCLHQAADAG